MKLRVSLVAAAASLLFSLQACQSMHAPVPAPAHRTLPEQLRVVTFNVGSGKSVDGVTGDNAGFGVEQSRVADAHYGNGLAWPAVIRDARDFFRRVDADLVALQEVFHAPRCADIPEDHHVGFICEGWQADESGVPARLLGSDYQVACHPGKPDKCLAVHRRLGRFAGCDATRCEEALEDLDPGGCGAGSRVAATTLDLASGGELRVVHLHGTSGVALSDARCRRGQVRVAFAEGGADPEAGLVLGDFNTDPGRVAWLDRAARALRREARPPGNYRFMTDVGLFAAPTFLSFLNIDHVLAAGMDGSCWAAGRTPDTEAVSETVYFDHTAIVCDLRRAE
jgi:endonuclease/exonuclease/phosphatase family metal-dependent hydrolase